MVKKFLKNEQNAHILFFAFVVICIAFTLSISRGILVKYDEMVYGQEVQELEEQITQTENLEKKATLELQLEETKERNSLELEKNKESAKGTLIAGSFLSLVTFVSCIGYLIICNLLHIKKRGELYGEKL